MKINCDPVSCWQPAATAPLTSGSYLVVVIGSPWRNIKHAPIVREAWFSGEDWTDGECIPLTVTHWQSLPAPPAGICRGHE